MDYQQQFSCMSTKKLKVLQSVRSQAEQAAQGLVDSAAEQEVAVVAKVSIFPVSEFPGWATTLAKALCENPELAKEPNHRLAAVIEANEGKSGFNPKVISKNLSAAQQSYAADILREHGYRVTDLFKGTDIKRIVLDGVGSSQSGKDSATAFFADGVSIDGKVYQYRQRNTTPTGMPWNDLCIRIAGVEVPLQTVLTLRNVGIGQFQLKDAAAKAFASTEQTVRRQQKLDREPKVHRSVAELSKAVRDNQWPHTADHYTNSELGILIKTWCSVVTKARDRDAPLLELLDALPNNPAMLKALEQFARRPSAEAANEGNAFVPANDDGAMAA